MSALIAVFSAGCQSDQPADQFAETWELGAEEVRIGSVDDPDAMLSDVAHVFVTRRDQVLIAQPQDATVRLHDALTGRLIRRLGRRGDGPNEFRSPGRIGVIGDTLWVSDESLRRVTLYDSAGSYLSERRWPDPTEGSGGRPSAFATLTADGRTVFATEVSDWQSADEQLPVVAIGPTRDVVLGYRIGLPQFNLTPVPGREELLRIDEAPHWTRTLWAFDPEARRLVFADRLPPTAQDIATYRLTGVTAEGDTIMSSQVPYDPVPIPDAVRDSLSQELPEPYALRFYPPVSAVVAGRDGTTWVARENTGAPTRGWDIFDASGRMIGRLDAPAALDIQDATSERVWAVVPDVLDVPYVARYRIRSGPG